MKSTILKLQTLALSLGLLLLITAGNVSANGEVGDHVNDLASHMEQYEEEVVWLMSEIDELVETYGNRSTAAINPERVTELWEEVDFHAAIEVNHVPTYASIWQGLFGVRAAMESESTLTEVRAQQDLLNQSFWQALGAVKLAADLQRRGVIKAVAISEATTPLETMDEIKQNLNRVVAKYAEQLPEEATEIVHDTYLTRFEGLEGMLIERDANLVVDLELDFNVTLPQAIAQNDSLNAVRSVVQAMQGKLDRARSLLEDAEENRISVF
ncbi:MAG: hypothetical protein OXE78_10575 [Gammaproteobacteria bacterium]|nr:hypothetical protein [Gammaproteobacteria bacterium]MCY4357820.1 hypothetical protein [Gammaproteobacteria bacterium]